LLCGKQRSPKGLYGIDAPCERLRRPEIHFNTAILDVSRGAPF
jgi:hypothetical protein